MNYIYMLRCKDNSLYTGIASELVNRMKTHFEGGASASKYVSSRGAAKLECYWICNKPCIAARLEYRLKTLTKKQKESLILGETDLTDYFSQMLDCSLYEKGDMSKKELYKYTGEEIGEDGI